MTNQSLIRGYGYTAALAIAGLTVSLTCPAQTINVVNGGFDKSGNSTQLTSPNVTSPNHLGGGGTTQNVTGWTVNRGLVWVYVPQSGTVSGTQADNMGATSYGLRLANDITPAPQWKLWGPGTGSTNGLTNAPAPAGGNFIALDGDATGIFGEFVQGQISQALSGLTPGEKTEVSFFMAAGQAFDFSADVGLTEKFQVSLCPGQSASSPVTNCAGGVESTPARTYGDRGFSPWAQETLTFTPTSAREVLSFLSVGTPGDLPPIALLDGVSVKQVPVATPEPGTWSLLVLGFAIAVVASRRRKWPGVPA